MPLPLLPIITTAIQAGSQIFANRAERKFSEKQYDKQRADALADWNMQNEYNSPEKQMERLKNAGLNPNLVYGSGSVGNAAGMPRAATQSSWKPSAPQFDINAELGKYQNLELQKAQVELLRTNAEVRRKDADLKDAELIGKLVKNSSLQLGYKRDSELYNNSIEFAKEKLRNLQQSTATSFANQYLTMGKSYMQSQQNRLMDMTLTQQVELVKTNVAKGQMDIRKGLEMILTMQAERSKIPLEKMKLNMMIADINAGISLKEVETKLKELDYSTGSQLGKTILGGLVNKLLK